MRTPLLAIAAFVVAALGLPCPAAAQPEPPSATPAPPAPIEPPPPSEPAAPAVPPVSAQHATFGPPSQLEGAPSQPAVSGSPRNPTTAALLSVGATIGSWAMFYGGLREDSDGSRQIAMIGLLGTWLGPNLGHWYQGTLVTRGTGLRLLGGLTTFYSVIRCIEGCTDGHELIALGGFALYVAATIDDLVDAPRRADRHNEQLKLGLSPIVTSRSAGLALGGSF
jgi:hypothetical protein